MVSKVGTNIQIETFELAPLNQAVMTNKGRLVRHFPASATAIEVNQAANVDLQTVIAQALSLMSEQPAPGLQPQAKKAGQMHDKDRDTTHPGMVCEFFNGFVTAVGAYTNVEVIAKNTREDVLWADARSPWRRCPIWLLIRVSLQLGFLRLARAKGGPNLYKQFMLFLMSHILQKSTPFSLDTELLYVMIAKLSRRLSKLEPKVDPLVEESVRNVMCQAHELISSRWLAIQKSETRVIDLSLLSSLDFKRDAKMDLFGLDEFVEAIGCREPRARNPDFHPVSHLTTYSAHSLPNVDDPNADHSVAVQNLHGFETRVGSYLSNWVDAHMNDSSACGQLASLMKRYHSLATQHYCGNVEASSVMILVTLELWIACDKIATFTCSLLDGYRPGISEDLLQSLLLPFRSQMDRLISAENHLTARAQPRWPSTQLFESTEDPDCFAARYFDRSAEHQSLHQRVIDRATQAKTSKLRELQRVKEEYAQLMRLHHQTSCEYHERIIDYDLGLTKEYHSNSCAHCRYNTDAGNLSISVFEWSLPASPTKAKTVVFELSVPAWFAHWRDSTMYLLLDVLGAEYTCAEQPRSSHPLRADPHLARSFFSPPHSVCPQRLELLSQDKPHVGTHRRGRVMSTANERDVCLQSGLRYQYYDSSSHTFFGRLNVTEKVSRSCTYVLPDRSKALQKFICRPAQFPNGPPPNTVIADQSECPNHMTLHEFKELASIPLAYHLQWLDIAVQLHQPSVDFKKLETALVFLQCIYQTGPRRNLEDPLRESHELLDTHEFAVILLHTLNAALGRIERNWESLQTLAVLIAIARRLLSLNSSDTIKDDCVQYLQRASAISLGWARHLKDKAHQAGTTDREQLLSRSAEAALICGSTFDIDRVHLPTVLADTTAASMFLQCCLSVFEGRLSLEGASDTQMILLYSRHQRLLRDSYHILAADQDALHDAIKNSWPAYRPEKKWKVSESACHWVVTRTATPVLDEGLMVHYNLLSGELLVNGLPLDRLPSEYEQHPNYRSLFGRSTIEVMPSNVPGMHFSSKREHYGHQIHFGLSTVQTSGSTDLVMQVSNKTTGAIFELIPSRLFRGHFPGFL